jgi:hypothetical protein
MIHWNYLLALEDDLNKVSRFIEFHKDNFECYSVELSHLLLSAASEVDVVAKGLISKNNFAFVKSDISKYRSSIKQLYPLLCEVKVIIPRFNLCFIPWHSWITDQTPDWWHAYNDVKHERNNNYHQANLENTLNAFAGLLILTLYYYKVEAEKGILTPPKLFMPKLKSRLGKSEMHPSSTKVSYIFPE